VALPGVFDRLINAVAQRGLAFGQELVTWMASVQVHAIEKWTPVVAAQILCSRDSSRGPCHRQAIAACLVCREAVCLEHACIAANADVACSSCMHELVKKALESQSRAMPPEDPKPPPEPVIHPLEERRLRALHLQVLGLAPGAPEDLLRKSHKKLSARWHPDRYQTPHDRETALRQYKQVQVAFDWLTRFGTTAKAA
jgi:hypothetical protein